MDDMTAGSILHASHDSHFCSLADAQLLHDGFEAGGCPNSEVWEYRYLLARPRFVWGIGDALQAKIHAGIQSILLLPTTPALKASAAVVQQAIASLGTSAAPRTATAELGGVVMSTGPAGRFASVAHLVCRLPGDARLRHLDQCLRKLQCGRFTEYILPIWGQAADVAIWADAIAAWLGTGWDIQHGRVSVCAFAPPEEKAKGERLERELITRGVLVGRLSESGDKSYLDLPAETRRRFASLVGTDRAIHPERFAEWVHGGVRLAPEAWDRHLQILKGTSPA